MKRRFPGIIAAVVCLVVVAALPVGGCGSRADSEAGAPALRTVRIGYQPSTHQVAEMMAMEKGWWQQALASKGVSKVTDYNFPTGPPEMSAMLAGELDVAYVGAAPAVAAIYQGLDAKIVAAVQDQGSELLVRTGLRYKNPRDLVGLRIGTFPPGSIQDTILRKWLIDNGLNPKRDLDIVPLDTGAAISALKANALDGVFLPHPTPVILEAEGTARSVATSGQMWPQHICCVLVVTGKMIREHPSVVEDIVRTHIKATKYVNAHREDTITVAAKRIGLDVGTIKKSLERWDGHWIYDPHTRTDSVRAYAHVLQQLNSQDRRYARSLSEDDIYDYSFYDRIMAGTP